MSKEDNIALHLYVISQARTLPIGSTKRLELIHRSISGIVRAKLPSYQVSSYEGQ